MSRIRARLTASPINTLGDAESSSLFLQPLPGASLPIVDAAGAVQDIPILASATAAMPSYDISALPAQAIYDVWATEVSGVATVGLLAWNMTRPMGSGPCGIGVFGNRPSPAVTESPYWGIPVNSAAMTLRMSDGSSLAVNQNRATFLGSIRISDADGVIKCHTSYNTVRQWGIWNAHNQREILVKGGSWSHPTDWSYALQYRQYARDWSPWLLDQDGNELTGHLEIFAGRPGRVTTRFLTGAWLLINSGTVSIVQSAIGWDSKTIPSGTWGAFSYEDSNQFFDGAGPLLAEFEQQAFFGPHDVYPLVKIQGPPKGMGTNCIAQLWGEELRGCLSARWWG